MNISDRLLAGTVDLRYRIEFANSVMFPNAYYILAGIVLMVICFYLYIKFLPCDGKVKHE